MAALSSSHYGGGANRHERNRSEELRQNFSYPSNHPTHQSPLQSPTSPDEFVTPQSSTFPPTADEYSQYSYQDGYQNAYDNGVMTERVLNAQSSQYDTEMNKRTNTGGRSEMQPARKKQARAPASSTSRSYGGSSRSKPRQELDYHRQDSSNWVHREKLITLEIQDHKDRGLPVPPALMEAYRESTAKWNVDVNDLQQQQQQHNPREDSLQYANFEEPEVGGEASDDEPYIPEDPRSPEEIAAEIQGDEAVHPMYHSPALRSSSSRIPISKRSPHPVPQEHIERNTPMSRKRSASIGWEGDDSGIMYPRTRSRSQSMGSQVLLDDTGEPMPSMPSSPSETRQTRNSPRKSSGAASKPRMPSNDQRASPGVARPTTRDGRPRTATNRPEEPAPWLAEMYKPDPRLPPDQQIIPTHAKRMLQEEQERSMAEATARGEREEQERQLELRKQQNNPAYHQELQQQQEEQFEKDRLGQQPELQQRQKQQLRPEAIGPIGEISTYENGQLREKTRSPGPRSDSLRSPNSEHGGYSTMPPRTNTTVTTGRGSEGGLDNRMQMVEEAELGGKKSKGCGCCVVM